LIVASQAQLDGLNSQAEAAAERYNKGRIDLEAAQVKVQAAQVTLAKQDAQVAALRAQAGAFAAQSYRSAGGGAAQQLAIWTRPGSAQDILSGLATLDAVAQKQSDVLAQLATARARQRSPPDLVAVGRRDESADSGRAQPWRQQPEWSSRAEPHRLDPLALDQGGEHVAHAPRRQQHRSAVAQHTESLARVVLVRAIPTRRVDNHVVSRQPLHEPLHEGLDAARARREVIRDNEGARHGAATPCAAAHARASAIRSGLVGCVANSP